MHKAYRYAGQGRLDFFKGFLGGCQLQLFILFNQRAYPLSLVAAGDLTPDTLNQFWLP